MRRTSLLGLALTLSLVGCASRADDAALGLQGTTTEANGPSQTAPLDTDLATCAPDDLDATALEPLIVDDRPGFDLQADDAGETGPSDLAKAGRDDEQPDGELALTALRFRRGYQRFWANDAGQRLVVFVYEFCDGADATAYGNRVFDYVVGLEPFEVLGAPGARGISGTTDGFVVAYAAATFNSTLVFTITSGPEGTDLLGDAHARAAALLIDQGASLTSS